ncbi:YjbH domain-containing protein [Shigella sonnei]
MPTTLNSATGVAQRYDEIHRLQRENRTSTAYWTPSFAQDVLVKASVGQYLAGDKGGTLEIAKRFDSGVVVGAMPRSRMFRKRSTARGLHQRRVCLCTAGSLLVWPDTQPCGDWLDAADA